jgi:hypothetical protein
MLIVTPKKPKHLHKPTGRPREYDRDQIGLDMIEWAKKDDSLNLNAFCAIADIAPSQITQWAHACPNFMKAYEKAKAHLGARREECLRTGKLHVKAYDLNASVYDHFTRDEKRSIMQFEADLKAKDKAQYSEADAERYEALMSQLRSLQSKSESNALNNAPNSNSKA